MGLKIDPKLRDFATDRQKEYIDAVDTHGSVRKASGVMGVHHSVIQRSLHSLAKYASLRGYSPKHDMDNTTPVGFSVIGTTTLYDAQRQRVSQYVKTKQDKSEAEEAIREFIAVLTEGCHGKSKLIPAPKTNLADILAVYPMGDPHFGMQAIAAECGEAFDLDMAVAHLKAAFDRLVDGTPAAETALIAELGDFFHSDNESNRTARSGNALDVSTRWAEVMQVGLRTMIYCIEKTASKHKNVIVRIVRGNHDEHSSFALALALDAYFHNNPRIKIIVDPSKFWYYEFGNVLIGLTHGDTAKFGDLSGIMSVDRPEAWGRTKHRYWYQGHIHHKQMKEQFGALVESFRTLAGRDAWHHGEGYRSGRDMHAIVHHKIHGEIQRSRCDIGLILEDLAKKK